MHIEGKKLFDDNKIEIARGEDIQKIYWKIFLPIEGKLLFDDNKIEIARGEDAYRRKEVVR